MPPDREAKFATMKRVFPVIAILTALSVVGLFIVEVQWFSNLLVVQGERFKYKVDVAALKVVEQLGKQSSPGRIIRLQRKRDLNLAPDNLSFPATRPPSIAQQYTVKEIYDRLREAFDNEDLKKFRFEFAITSNTSDSDFSALELQSPNFYPLILDSVRTKKDIIPIIPETGSEFEGLMALEHLIIVIPDFRTVVWQSITWIIVGAIIFNLIIIAAFYLAIRTIFKQRKLNAIKNDFINNMTHELKTPLATISLAVDALKNEKVLADKDKLAYFSNIIKDENKRMGKHVETILQAGLMERQDIKMSMHPVHINVLLPRVLESYNLQLKDKGGEATLLLNAKNDLVNVDEQHFSNLISNLVDNAIKYSKETEPVHIKVTTHSSGKTLILQIADNGIGMSKETVKRIFEKFYRAHTGNLHNVKGFGLGMSYVKTIVDAHKGKIKVDSVYGKGSTFTMEFPLSNLSNEV